MESGFRGGEMDGQTDMNEGNLEAAIATSRQRAEAKSVLELQRELDAVRLKLLRRSQIIDTIRKAYVRDVVVVKNELMRKSAMTDEEYFVEGGPGTNITDAVPSLDMRPVLELFSPEDSFLKIETCSACGGHLEIVTRETKQMAKLTMQKNVMAEKLQESIKDNAQTRAELMLTRQRMKELELQNSVNKDTLLAMLEKMKRSCAADIAALKEASHQATISWRSKLACKEQELEMLPVLRRELESIRQKLMEEKRDREEDLHLKDGEIAELSSKVKDLESSAEADAKVLLDARNKCDELQHLLKTEKGVASLAEAEHSVTRGLLDEQRSRYERCRRSLETAQAQLADLNVQYNELRAEVEAMAEAAQDDALKASGALSAAKMEVKRLQGLLVTSDTTKAMEEAKRKLSALSEELKAARTETREANQALREAQERIQRLQQTEELRLQVSQYEEKIDALEAEAAENREKLKKMTEELKKMEAETGLSVGLAIELEMEKKTITKMKIRQAMVTHELLGRIKGVTAEADMLRAQLEKVSKERQGFQSSAKQEEIQRLKEEKINAALRRTLQESSDAFKKALVDISRACKETRRAKLKVWNERELDRARSIPPPVPGDGKKRASVVRRRTPDPQDVSGEGGGSSGGHSPPASQVESGPGKDAKGEKDNEAALEKKRAQKTAQDLAKKLQKEEDEKELHDLEAVCASPEKGGVEFAAERLKAVQIDVKEQFKGVFVELKQALEMHKKFIIRSRVEARDRVAKVAALEAEIKRLITILESTEEELNERSAALYQTNVALRAEKDTVVELQRGLKAAQKEAQYNLYFKEKNASLQKKMDRMDISSRGLRREAAKAKAELRDQAGTLADLRQRVEESEKREGNIKEEYEALEKRLRETEDKVEELEERQKRKLEALKSSATQVNDQELRVSQLASTQTTFHSPQLTLRRSNNHAMSAARSNQEARSANSSRLSSPEDGCFRRCARSDPMTGIVCPTVNGWAVAAERDLYSPGTGSKALLEAHSLQLIPLRPPAWAVGACLRATARTSARAQCVFEERAQRHPTHDATNWGLWDEGEARTVSTPMTKTEDHCVVDSVPDGDHPPRTALVGHPDRQESDAVEPEEQTRLKTVSGGFNSPTRRLQNRIFFQSARDPSLCSPERRVTNATPPELLMNSIPMATIRESDRPKTSAAALSGSPRRRDAFEGRSLEAGLIAGNRPLSVPTNGRKAAVEPKQVIDMGVLAELPRARVWDEQKMAAAAAAAVTTERRVVSSGQEPGVVGWGWGEGVVTRGGVVMDTRLASFRKALRRDVLDAAERARLPMLQ